VVQVMRPDRLYSYNNKAWSVHYSGVLRFLACVLLLTFATVISAESEQSGYYPDIEYLQLSHDETNFSLDDARASEAWQPVEGRSPNFGYVPDTFWFRFSLSAASDRRIDRTVSISYPQLDHITYYLVENGVAIERIQTGDHYPFSQRPVRHPHFLFPHTLEPGNDYQVFLRVESKGTVQVPLRVWEPNDLFENLSLRDQANALYYGILIVIICFNLFIYFALREKTYIYYALTIASILLLMGTLRGTAFAILWPDLPWLHNQMMLVSVPATTTFSALFTSAFLKLRRKNPALHRMMQTIAVLGGLALMASFVLDYNTSIQLSVGLAIPGCLLMLIIGPIEWARGNRAARYYTVAWAMFSAGSVLAAMNFWGWLPNNFITEFSMQIGSALEAILLTIALAERLYQEREDRVIAQDARLREHAERRQAELRLMDQALHHPITALPNRTCFEMLVRDVVRNEARARHAVCVVQLRNYQAIHKTLGHANTDRLLKSVALHVNRLVTEIPGIRIVEQTDRDRFYAATLEAPSFALLLDAGEAKNHPDAIAEALEKLREPFDFLGMQLPLDPVAGVAIYPEHGTDPSTLIRRAYIAQESEEARYRHLAYYRLDRDVYSAERLTLVSELKQALEQGKLELYLQPKLHLRSQEVVGVEGLVRWPGRDQPVSADVIVAVAEETGLIKPLTRWVLDEAIRTRQVLFDAGHDLSVAINISANNLREPDFPIFVQRLLSKFPEHRGRICLELTETSMMIDPITSLRSLRALDSAGIPIAVDDFGSGYSSLSYIKQLPASEIKIDKSLITDLVQHPDDRVIVQTTVDMCHSLGYSVVAEGVEDQETCDLLAHIGCDQIQGFLMTRPLPLEQLLTWLNSGQYPSRQAV